ncbi:hypothetical protein HK405_009619 [Cladochytrium tenue]|nr:hypothetical protein HK405_009619 [Cladochytrium tenue]
MPRPIADLPGHAHLRLSTPSASSSSASSSSVHVDAATASPSSPTASPPPIPSSNTSATSVVAAAAALNAKGKHPANAPDHDWDDRFSASNSSSTSDHAVVSPQRSVAFGPPATATLGSRAPVPNPRSPIKIALAPPPRGPESRSRSPGLVSSVEAKGKMTGVRAIAEGFDLVDDEHDSPVSPVAFAGGLLAPLHQGHAASAPSSKPPTPKDPQPSPRTASRPEPRTPSQAPPYADPPEDRFAGYAPPGSLPLVFPRPPDAPRGSLPRPSAQSSQGQGNHSRRPSGVSAPHSSAPDLHNYILSGFLWKKNRHNKFQKRLFRFDGLLLVCLSPKRQRLPEHINLMTFDPERHLSGDRSDEFISALKHFYPTSPPMPALTNPLVASYTQNGNPDIYTKYFHAPKWIVPTAAILSVRAMAASADDAHSRSFVIQTEKRNYVLRAASVREFRRWCFLLSRMSARGGDSPVPMNPGEVAGLGLDGENDPNDTDVERPRGDSRLTMRSASSLAAGGHRASVVFPPPVNVGPDYITNRHALEKMVVWRKSVADLLDRDALARQSLVSVAASSDHGGQPVPPVPALQAASARPRDSRRPSAPDTSKRAGAADRSRSRERQKDRSRSHERQKDRSRSHERPQPLPTQPLAPQQPLPGIRPVTQIGPPSQLTNRVMKGPTVFGAALDAGLVELPEQKTPLPGRRPRGAASLPPAGFDLVPDDDDAVVVPPPPPPPPEPPIFATLAGPDLGRLVLPNAATVRERASRQDFVHCCNALARVAHRLLGDDESDANGAGAATTAAATAAHRHPPGEDFTVRFAEIAVPRLLRRLERGLAVRAAGVAEWARRGSPGFDGVAGRGGGGGGGGGHEKGDDAAAAAANGARAAEWVTALTARVEALATDWDAGVVDVLREVTATRRRRDAPPGGPKSRAWERARQGGACERALELARDLRRLYP